MAELAVGIDIVRVERFAQAVDRCPRLLYRLFTPSERASCLGPGRIEQLAGRFAAKEAAFKALGEGWPRIGYREVQVASTPSGSLQLRLRGQAATLAASREVAVSIAHDGGIAIAEVVLSPRP